MIWNSFTARLTVILALLGGVALASGISLMAYVIDNGRAESAIDLSRRDAERIMGEGGDTAAIVRRHIAYSMGMTKDNCMEGGGQRRIFLLRDAALPNRPSGPLSWPGEGSDSFRIQLPDGMPCLDAPSDAWGVIRHFHGGDFAVAHVVERQNGLWTQVALIGVGIVTLFVVFAIGIGAYFARGFNRRVHALNAVLDQVEQSGFSVRARSDREAGAEFAELALHINAMISRMGDLTGNLSRITLHIAHDLRSPLEVLQRHLRRLHDQLDDERNLEVVDQARERVSALMARCEQLLAIARVETATQDAFAEVELRDQLEMLVEDMFLDVSVSLGVQIMLDAPEEIGVTGLPEVIQRMFANILQNAMKFAVKGSTIRVNLFRDGPMARVEIENDGPVVAEDRLEVIFDPNVATSVTSGGGYGLGLPFVRAAARRHGGDAFAERLPNGMRMVMRIPVR